MNYCIQWLQRTSNLLDTEVRSLGNMSSSQGLTGETVEQICPLQPFPTLLWGYLTTSAEKTCPCTQRTVPLLLPLPLYWVQLTAWDRALHLLLSWKERTGKLPDKLLNLCRWNKSFSSHSVRNPSGKSNPSAFGSGGTVASYLNTVGTTKLYPCEDPSPPQRRNLCLSSGSPVHTSRTDWVSSHSSPANTARQSWGTPRASRTVAQANAKISLPALWSRKGSEVEDAQSLLCSLWFQ